MVRVSASVIYMNPATVMSSEYHIQHMTTNQGMQLYI